MSARKKTPSRVVHPEHYNSGKIEVWDFIADQDLDFFEGNVIKYLCRFRSYDRTNKEHIEKAYQYMKKLCENHGCSVD